MNLSIQIIKAVAQMYSIEELQTELQNAVKSMLENPERIVSASTGAGASYTKALNITAQELVELLSMALEFKQSNGVISNGGSNIMNFVSNIR
jgi:hypothetical protein